MTRYYVVDCDTGLIWLSAASSHQANRIADELNREYRKCVFGFKAVFTK